MTTISTPFKAGVLDFSKEAVLRDYRVGVRSRQTSLIARQEVMTGRAKFGIFGDGKEVAQLAMAYAFRPGDVRAGYYRDQTFMFAVGALTVPQLFAQLYAHADVEAEPATAGRAMNGHFATRMVDEQGKWRSQLDSYNISADLSPTAAQMPRLVGLGYASKLYRQLPGLEKHARLFSNDGNEIAFGTIGNAGCAEGLFWEAVNAIGVLQVPVLLSIWDDGYGISVPNRFQITKGNIGQLLSGFQRQSGSTPGLDLHSVVGWDYPRLCETYLRASGSIRREHVPAIIHVTELTQPLGHSTSGSHERYKSSERLAWEKENDCLVRMRDWIVDEGMASLDELGTINEEERESVIAARDQAWEACRRPLECEKSQLIALLGEMSSKRQGEASERLTSLAAGLGRRPRASRRDFLKAAQRALLGDRELDDPARQALLRWRQDRLEENAERYGSDLYSETEESAMAVSFVPPRYGSDPIQLNGFEILNACFDAALRRLPQLVALGEDVGLLGDVNQGFAHLQEKYGEARVSDTGIREATIVGQAIGMALRGLRPIAEIQYLDYILYALQILSDDLASLRWRTKGGQRAPVIIRTRGHRLEGVWHSGSPMAGVIHLCRGLMVCVPRDATRAAGFYNTLLRSDDAGIIVEVLNGYRLKEPLPNNVGEMTTPLGLPEVLREGSDVTVVTYGALCRIAEQATRELAELGIEVELIDVQTLLPFDVEGRIVQSLEKTNRILFLDEDVPGGATAYMLQQVLEHWKGYEWLDGRPRTLTATAHRPAYGSDGDYFSKPSHEDIVATVYEMIGESDPGRFPKLLD